LFQILFYFWCVYQYFFGIFFHFVKEKHCTSKTHWHSTFFWKEISQNNKNSPPKKPLVHVHVHICYPIFFSSWKIWILSPICICIWTHMSIYHAYPSVCLPSKLGWMLIHKDSQNDLNECVGCDLLYKFQAFWNVQCMISR
jgi:hypothetical protein